MVATTTPPGAPVRQLWPVPLRDVLPAASLADVLHGTRSAYFDLQDAHAVTFTPILGYAPADERVLRFRDAEATSFTYRNPLPIASRFLARIEDATLIYDSYLSLKDRFLIADSYHNEELLKYVIAQELPVAKVRVRFGGEDVPVQLFFHRFENLPVVDEPCLVVASRCPGNYWHWFMDVLPRLWPLLENRLDGPCRLLLPKLTTSFQHDSLRWLGIDPARALFYSPPGGVRLRQALYPSMLTPGGYSPAIPAFYQRFFSRLNLAGPGKRRLFVSRQSANYRRLLNETELFDQVLRPLGFEIVHCHNLPFAAQAQLFAQAEVVVGSHGAGLTNLLFAPPGTLCVELLNERIAGKFYWLLASALNHRYGCWAGRAIGDPQVGAMSDFVVDLPPFKAYLLSLLDSVPS